MSGLKVLVTPIRYDAPSASTLGRRGLQSFAGVVCQGSVRFGTSALLGRIGGPVLLGLVQSGISIAQLLALLWPTSSGSAAAKFVAQSRGRGDPAEGLAVAKHIARRTSQISLGLFGLAILLWIQLGFGSLRGALVVGLLTVSYSGYSFTRGLQFGTGQVARATAWDVATGLTGLCGVAIVLLSGGRGLTVLIPLALAYLLYAAAAWPIRPGAPLTKEHRREIDLFIGLGVLGTIASAGFLQLSVIVSRTSGGLEQAGQYAAALALATPASMLAGSFSLVLFPAMAEAWGRGDSNALKAQTDRATRVMVAIMVGLFGVIALVGRPLSLAVWGAKFNEVQTVLPILILAVLLTTLAVPSVNAITSGTNAGMAVSAGASLTGLVAGTLFWVIVAPEHPMVGVPAGYLIGAMLNAGIPIVLVWRRDRHSWKGLTLTVALGIGLAGGLLALERSTSMPAFTDLGFAAGFLVVWSLWQRRELQMVFRSLSRKRTPTGTTGQGTK